MNHFCLMQSIIRHSLFPLGVGVVILTVLFLLFFPPTFVSIDEHQYYKNSLLLQQGELKTANPIEYCGGTFRGEQYLSSFHIGKSIFLIPFTWAAFPFVMLSGLILHLINMGIFSLILRKLKLSQWLVLLFAFYPAFLWESRTLFSETFALVFLLAGTYFYLDERLPRKFWAGLLLGLGAFVRTEAVLIAIAFGIALIWKERHTLRKPLSSPILWFAAGGVIAAGILLGWNNWYNGGPFATQLGSPSRLFEGFPRPLFFANLIQYVAVLCIAFPLMLLALLKPFRLRLELILATIFTLALFSQTANISVYEFFSPLTITARIRYFIPLAGLLLIAYAHAITPYLNQLATRLGRVKWNAIVVLFILVLTIGAFALNSQHQTLVEKRAVVETQLLTNIPSNAHVIGSSDDCIYFLPQISGTRTYSKVDDPMYALERVQSEVTTPIYVMQLRYSNQSDSDVRQDVIDKERMALQKFVDAHKGELVEVFTTKQPHSLTIYRFQGQD